MSFNIIVTLDSIPPKVPVPSPAPQGQFPQPPDIFARPFPVSAQQFAAHIPQQVPTARTAHGWEGEQLDRRFAQPIAAALQQYAAFQPAGRIVSFFPDGWRGAQWDNRFARGFPAVAQIFSATPSPRIFAPTLGWWGQQFDHRFARPYPAAGQQFAAFQPRGTISPPVGPQQGWWGYQFDHRFAQPFPVTEQIFSVWVLLGEVPVFHPPGAGKRRDFPSYIPQPDYDAKPNKPFRPVWDRPKQGAIEEHPAKPAGPPPLPPGLLFGRSSQAGSAKAAAPQLVLPDFSQYAPPDPIGLADHMRDVQDQSDALAVLKALGIIPNERIVNGG